MNSIVERWPIKCDACGNLDSLPFQPTEGRKYYCHKCWAKKRDQVIELIRYRVKQET